MFYVCLVSMREAPVLLLPTASSAAGWLCSEHCALIAVEFCSCSWGFTWSSSAPGSGPTQNVELVSLMALLPRRSLQLILDQDLQQDKWN